MQMHLIGGRQRAARKPPPEEDSMTQATPAADLTLVSFAGPDLGILCATGKVRRALYPFASPSASLCRGTRQMSA